MSLNKLSPTALKVAMECGTEGWGQHGSALRHRVYVEPAELGRRWRKCYCGCGKRATHRIAANGVTLGHGCELEMRRTAKSFTAALRAAGILEGGGEAT